MTVLVLLKSLQFVSQFFCSKVVWHILNTLLNEHVSKNFLLQQASHEGELSSTFPKAWFNTNVLRLGYLRGGGGDILGNAFSGNFYSSGAYDRLQEKLTEVEGGTKELKSKFWVRFILLSFYLSSGLPH